MGAQIQHRGIDTVFGELVNSVDVVTVLASQYQRLEKLSKMMSSSLHYLVASYAILIASV